MLPIVTLFALQQLAVAAGPTPYWQQYVRYEITARLDEPTHTLGGSQRVTYVNHSPDTLHVVSFHLYLNAFRPHSLWSRADSAERVHRFDHLADSAYGFNHIRDVQVGGVPVAPIYPFAPDSTIARLILPAPLAPGDSATITMNWDARPSIPPRRQGRRGRSYDFAQWYPKVVVYDKYGLEEHPLYPAGEFYGEFGDFYVKLDVPKDEVIGATGVPVCGDPGWSGANQESRRQVELGADQDVNGQTYLRTVIAGDEQHCGAHGTTLMAQRDTVNGRKQLLWVARDVHNFAITMSPDYRYEGGEWNGIQVHVLYQPGDEKTWGGGIVVNNTINTLKWMNVIFGRYPWPEMTVAHRIEGGGTEFPMMQMNGSPSQGLNLHEGGHSYLMGILANNEWKEGWMDEGFTSFQTAWWEEIRTRNDGAVRTLEAGILLSDLDHESQPVSTVSEKFRDFSTYNNMIYNRGELFLFELQRMVGDSTMLEILHRYYARWQLRHVDENAFKAVAEEVSRRDLSTFFAQWLHDVDLTDYAVRGARREATPTGWRTTVDIARKAPGQFPVTVAVYAAHDTAYAPIDGVAESERVVVATGSKPRRVMLDPLVISHDWNMLNNQYTFGRLPHALLPDRPVHRYFDTYFPARARRDALVVGIMPTAWYNDAGGATIGIHFRSNYLGRFDQNSAAVFCGVRNFGANNRPLDSCGFSVSLGSPTWWRAPNVSERLDAFRFEGRAGAGLSAERSRAAHSGFGPTHTLGASLQWLATYDMSYLPATLWDDGGSAEGAVWWGVADTRGGWALKFTAKATGGVMYSNPAGGFTTERRYDAQAYARPELSGTAVRSLGRRTTLGVRGYAAAVLSADPVLSQRRLFVAGADPYQTISNPFVRSVGAPLLRDDCSCQWHTPGDGDLRGYDQALSADRLVAVNAELVTTLWQTKRRLLGKVGLALFGDAGFTGTASGIGGAGDALARPVPDRLLADAGAGLRLTQRIGDTSWITRLDVPMYVSDPAWAFSHRQSTFGLNRLVVSLSPVIR